MDERIGFGLYQSSGDRGSGWTCVCVLVAVVWGGVGGEWVGGLDRGREPWGGVMSV